MEIDSKNSPFFNHKSVMVDQIVNSIENCTQKLSKNFIGIDATIGGGGHSYELLKKFSNLKIIGLDQDPFAIEAASNKLNIFSERVEIIESNFSDFKPKEKVSFIIADLGFNSNQIETPGRGFSIHKDGPIDMRMNPSKKIKAEDLINDLTEKELADLIFQYGEEKLSRRIARKIKNDLQTKGKYSGTKELAYAIGGCFSPKQRYKKIHPATRTFQALRIAVNNEIGVLDKLLDSSQNWLLPGGIISIISFHSIEDRKVKNYFKNNKSFLNLTKKPISPSGNEIEINKRSRSAKLRVAQLK
tara:strand:+ start:312 stop:1214 length:903 start_codon:yes stop_codon:yes gene_type:complete